MAVLFALLAALGLGFTDILGSVAVRRGRLWATTLWIFLLGVVGIALVSVIFGGSPTIRDGLLGAGAGLASGLALLVLYAGYSRSEIGIVGPTAGVIGAIVPVAAGISLDGAPSPVVLFGMAVGVVSVALIGWSPESGAGVTSSTRRVAGVLFGAAAGAGYGLMGLGLGLTSSDAGVWPATFTRLSAFVMVLFIATALRRPRLPVQGTWWHILGAAVAGSMSVALFTLAAQDDLAIAGLLIQMGYGVSVIGAILVFDERPLPTQRVGFAVAVLSVVLITLG